MQDKHPSLVSSARRDLTRLSKVSAIIVRHGFGELLLKTSLGRRLMDKGELPTDVGGAVQGSAAIRFTEMLASLGPTFIKLGQILSMRHDLLSKEWIDALQTLQDAAPVVPLREIHAQIEHALGMPVLEAFASFDETPIGTASIAQVHAATTHEGQRVVVKVQRPGIGEIMRGDLNLLYLAAQILEASIDELRLIGATDIVVEFEKALLRELDFRQELGNLLRMRSLLTDDGHVTVPRPYPELSDATVLTMDFFVGKPMRALEPESALAKRAVEDLVRSLCKQIFVDGFFHGDPHAGNILCNDEGTLCLLDLGLVGELTPEQRADVVDLLVATFANETSTVARILLKMGTPTQRVSLLELRAEIDRMRSKYIESTRSAADLDSAGFVQEFADAAQKFRIKLATEYAVLVKAVATVEGIVRQLHPHADIVALARPIVQSSFVHKLSPADMFKELASDVSTIGSLAHRLPADLDQLLHDFETGNLQIRADTPSLNSLPWTLQQAASRISLSLFAAAMSLCSALVLISALEPWPRYLLSGALALASTVAWLVLVGWHFVRGQPFRLTPLVKLFKR
ncbi:MAG TPA: AarF/UbiB family protein [Polyangiales bacterium]